MNRTDKETISSVDLEIFWSRLVAICDQAGANLFRTAFSPIIRESNDYCCVLMDRRGDALAENRGSIPSFVGTISRTTKQFLRHFSQDRWESGDIAMTNDPWLASGHRPDVSVVAPIFHKSRLVAFTGNIAHWADIGGVVFSADCRSVFEEGFGIPPMKIMKGGRINQDLLDMIRYNVRYPQMVMGDLSAQFAGIEAAGNLLVEFLDEYGLESLEEIGQAIQGRAEEAMRKAISQVPDGTYSKTMHLDGFSTPLQIQCKVTVDDDELEIDFTGTSPQTFEGSANSVFNYTWALCTYGVKAVLDPSSYKNEGSYRPIKVIAPEGTILNATFPAPVNARALPAQTGTAAVLGALAQAVPHRVIAECGTAPSFRTTFSGYRADRKPFTFLMFANGGMGARPNADGLGCTPFPSNASCASMELMEGLTPLLVWKKEIRQDSGGAGKFRGGCGQDLVIEVRGSHPVSLSSLSERWNNPAQGLFGGGAGLPNYAARISPKPAVLPSKGRVDLFPGDLIKISHAGGGGYGPPQQRDKQLVLQDLRNGVISPAAAAEIYGLKIATG